MRPCIMPDLDSMKVWNLVLASGESVTEGASGVCIGVSSDCVLVVGSTEAGCA